MLGAYIENTYLLRNEIVHRGSDATSLMKCYQAIQHALRFRDQIISLVKISKYKVTAEALKQLYFGRSESFAYKMIESAEDFKIIYDLKFREDFAKRINKDFGIDI